MKAVYVIAEEGADRCKIGVTNDPKKRVTVLQTGHPSRLYVAGAWESEDAEALERLVHEHLTSRRLVGEWFAVSPSDACFEVGRISARVGVDLNSVAGVTIREKTPRKRDPSVAVSPLQRWRLEENLSLHAAAAKIGGGIAHTTLMRVERGEHRPQRSVLSAITTRTGLSAAEILEPWLRLASSAGAES